ncbi:MAG TPA: hypothetical protein VN673_06650 [Clostridia bacterium]|nr:hypothetical protein [Clostridia bacterium]
MKVKMRHAVLFLLTLLAGLTTAAGAEAPTLNVGDPAPPLTTAQKWIRGKPWNTLRSDTAYAITFWEPDNRSKGKANHLAMQRMARLHATFGPKGLVSLVIEDALYNRAKARKFLKERKYGDLDVAADDVTNGLGDPVPESHLEGSADDYPFIWAYGKTKDAWVKASGSPALPVAFVVDKQKRVIWIGNPLRLPDDVVERVLADNYSVDLGKAATASAKYIDQRISELERELIVHEGAKEWEKLKRTLSKLSDLYVPEEKEDNGGHLAYRFEIHIGQENGPAASSVARTMQERCKNQECEVHCRQGIRLAMLPRDAEADPEITEMLLKPTIDGESYMKSLALIAMARVKIKEGSEFAANHFALRAQHVYLQRGEYQKSEKGIEMFATWVKECREGKLIEITLSLP